MPANFIRRNPTIVAMNPTLIKVLAWCVHGYTALGLIAAGGIAVAIFDGSPGAITWAFWLMFIATLVDATDGTLARAIQVKTVLPHFDGRRLDDIIDFQTYVSLPILLIWRTQLIPPELSFVLFLPLVASAYGFCQTTAKTDDGYFLGFPSYWNILAFYLYVLDMSVWLRVVLIVFFALMTFVPARYLYPTHRGRLNRWTNVLGGIWALLLAWMLIRMPGELGEGEHVDARTHNLAVVSLIFPAYYLVVSWFISARIWRRARHQHQLAEAMPATSD